MPHCQIKKHTAKNVCKAITSAVFVTLQHTYTQADRSQLAIKIQSDVTSNTKYLNQFEPDLVCWSKSIALQIKSQSPVAVLPF